MMLSLSSSGHTLQIQQSHRHVRAERSVLASHNGIVVCPNQLRHSNSTRNRRVALLPVRSSKDDVDQQLDSTKSTLDRVLQQYAASQPQSNGNVSDATFSNREQQLWDRQQSLLDRLQHHWDLERQAWLQEKAVWHERESSLLKELASLRSELQTLLTTQAAAAAAAGSAGSVVGSSPLGAAAASSSSSRPGVSDLAAGAVINTVISGPSSASAAVADAIRAVRDAHVTPPGPHRSSSSSSGSGADSWQGLFPSGTAADSSSSALHSVNAVTTADNDTDALSGLDSSHSSRTTTSSSSSNTDNGTGAAAAAADPSSSSSGTIETIKSDPTGPPPLLSIEDDDIYWVSQLHNALMTAGFYPADDEIENWVFADGTQSALLTFQACNGVPETGTTCESTWRKLLGEEHYEATYSSSSSSSSTISAPAAASSSNGGSSSSSSSGGMIVEEESETVIFSFSGVGSSSGGSSGGGSSGGGSSGSSSAARSGSSSSSSTWPILMDMDGGREVHALQVSLDRAGFFCGDDEMRWWQFGSSTMDALKTFQACNGLPESGVTDERTWLKLLGPDATPEDIDAVHGDENTYEDDMTAAHEGAVWLLGEQRWSRPNNGNDS